MCNFVKPYLPDHFFANESESILLFLSFKRMSATCQGIINALVLSKSQLPVSDSIAADFRLAKLSEVLD
jgi:hypothetical protein